MTPANIFAYPIAYYKIYNTFGASLTQTKIDKDHANETSTPYDQRKN